MHIEKQQRRFGEHVYGIMPKTYLLPKDYAQMRDYLAASPANHVIIKPVRFRLNFHINFYNKIHFSICNSVYTQYMTRED